jgi:hypothetical protein
MLAIQSISQQAENARIAPTLAAIVITSMHA